MKNKFDRLLLSLLLGTSVLLGLAFWLNTVFGFNLFFKGHWDELAQLQASNIPVSNGFYISIGVAVFIFLLGLYIIYVPVIKQIQKKSVPTNQNEYTPLPQSSNSKPEQKNDTSTPFEFISNTPSRPPRLNLPINMAEIVSEQHHTQSKPSQKSVATGDSSQNPYNPILSQIFSDNGYLIKPNPKFGDFVPNLFAIGPQEVLWIGAVDQDMGKLHQAIEKLQSVFQDTLEDIKININAFMLDTLNQYQSDDIVSVFKSVDDLKQFVSENDVNMNENFDQESFDAYSEYIDTIIQYIKNI